MDDLTGFQRDILYVIAGGDEPNGLAIKAELEDYYETEVHHGRLYPNLDSLGNKGLIEKGEVDRRSNYYRLTARGQREIEARQAWEEQYIALSTGESTAEESTDEEDGGDDTKTESTGGELAE
ncbi:transcriptional regulator PadR-like family protein [Halalkalicoccus paucihalophilus]|uniref:Transcriptional regulator PadR-like family protein n=1 Tax=Halalkalicoccus paucihalophilus TaxID=1008153 RepID=A0A151A8G6_9EURY|nr:transcriptional regulator PadR-like family protein [Halalkalicoccus paucihalophilus]